MKHFLLSLVLLVSALSARAAGEVWCMVTQSDQAIAMSQVHYLLSLGDDSEVFTIVCRDGSTVENVTRVTFSQTIPTAISAPVTHETALLSRVVGGSLVLLGCDAGTAISIVDLSGKTALQTTAQSRQTTIDISSLAAGVYVLRVAEGNQNQPSDGAAHTSTTLKFMKK